MGLIISALVKGFGQLSDPRTRSVILKSIGASIVVFIALYIALHFGLKLTAFVTIGWLEAIFDSLAQFWVMILTWFLFPAVVTAFASFMLDDVVKAVEERHYPNHKIAQGQTFAETLIPTLKFLGTTVGYNLLILPLFIVPPIWPLIPFIYLSLNGYLLGREFFELVALRRITLEDARTMQSRWKTSLFIVGIGFAFMLTVPILNLIAPVIATATMVHLFEGWRSKDGIVDKTSSPPNINKDHNKVLNQTEPSGPKSIDGDDDEGVISLPGPDQ